MNLDLESTWSKIRGAMLALLFVPVIGMVLIAWAAASGIGKLCKG